MGKKGFFSAAEGLELLAGWAAEGCSENQVAEKAGISRRTLTRWRLEVPQVAEALRAGYEKADRQVEKSLFEAAVGSIYTEQQAYKLKSVYYDENGHRREEERVEVVRLEKQRPPSTTAQMFWLKNRRPARWGTSPEPEEAEAAPSIEVRVVE